MAPPSVINGSGWPPLVWSLHRCAQIGACGGQLVAECPYEIEKYSYIERMATIKCLVESRVEIGRPSGQVTPVHAHTTTHLVRAGEQWQPLENTVQYSPSRSVHPSHNTQHTSSHLLTICSWVCVQVVAEMRQLRNLVVAQTGPPCPHGSDST